MSNAILIGMPGVGKSTAGVVAAKLMGFHFLDSDLVIQHQEGRLLKDIIAKEGNDEFLRIEERINAGIDTDKTVIATGGSVIYGPAAMEHFACIGKIIYLRASYETINSRLSNLAGRGVAIKDGQTLKELYDERSVLYEKYADFIVDIDGQTIEQTAMKIAELFT